MLAEKEGAMLVGTMGIDRTLGIIWTVIKGVETAKG